MAKAPYPRRNLAAAYHDLAVCVKRIESMGLAVHGKITIEPKDGPGELQNAIPSQPVMPPPKPIAAMEPQPDAVREVHIAQQTRIAIVEYAGTQCSHCGGPMKRAGSCEVCIDCGTSGGCG